MLLSSIQLRMLVNAFAASALLAVAGASWCAADKAAVFFEDALKRYERNDLDASIIQLKNAIKEDQKLLAAHVLLGKVLMRTGDFRGAEAAFDEALKQGVNRGEVAAPLGRIYIALGKPELAIERIAATGLPKVLQVEILAMRGTAYAESGNMRLAAQSFEEARAVDPLSPIPYIEEVPVLLQSGRRDAARAAAANAIKLAPTSAVAWNMQASVLQDALDAAGALEAYNRAVSLDDRQVDARIARAGLLVDMKRDADAQKDLDYLIDAAPEDPRAAYLRAQVALRKGDAAGVTKWLGAAAHVIDSLPPAWLNRREQIMLLAALSHHGLGNLQKAREYLDQILTRNPRQATARRLMASIYVQTRDYSRAMPLLEAMQKESPNDPQILYQMGSLYLSLGRFPLATQYLERASKGLDLPEVSHSLALAQLGMGNDVGGQATLERAFAARPADMKAGQALAMLYKRRTLQAKALEVSEAMVKRAPNSAEAKNFLGSMKAASGDRKGARALFAQILERSPDFLPALLNLAKLDVDEGRFEVARAQLTKVLQSNSENVDVLYELGMLEQRAGRIPEAVRHLKKAMESKRRDPRSGTALIDLQIGQKQAAEAVATGKAMASKYPEDLVVQMALARAHLAKGDAASARDVLQGASKIAEADPDSQVSIGVLQLAAGNVAGAAYSAFKALQSNPSHLRALDLNVTVELRRKDIAKAEEALKMMVAKQPDRTETATAAGAVALAKGQFQQAISAFRTALAREASTPNAVRLGMAYLAAGDAAQAAASLEKWLKAYPNDLIATKALAEAQHQAGQFAAARTAYARVMAMDATDGSMLNNFANLLLSMGDPEAEKVAERAVKLDPTNPIYADTLGWILVQKGNVDAGLRHLREARLRNPVNPDIRFHLAYALAKAGRQEEARSEFAAAQSATQKLSIEPVLVARLKKDLGL